MDNKLFGIGLGNVLSIFLFFLLLKVGLKVILTQTPVKGVSEVIHAA